MGTTKIPETINETEPGFLKRLEQYKSFVAILVFFFGGAMGVFGFFATKEQVELLEKELESQVKIVECFSNIQVAMVKNRMQTRFLRDDKNHKILRLEKIARDKDGEDGEDDFSIRVLKSEIEDLNSDIENAKTNFNMAEQAFEQKLCMKDPSTILPFIKK